MVKYIGMESGFSVVVERSVLHAQRPMFDCEGKKEKMFDFIVEWHHNWLLLVHSFFNMIYPVFVLKKDLFTNSFHVRPPLNTGLPSLNAFSPSYQVNR